MRVIFCKKHCPLICFCRPSAHIYTPGGGSLKWESQNTSQQKQHKAKTRTDDEYNGDGNVNAAVAVACPEQRHIAHHQQVNANDGASLSLRSSLRKSSQLSESESFESSDLSLQKKKVHWSDYIGKDLVQIKEFESSEEEDTDNGGVIGRGCVCSIL